MASSSIKFDVNTPAAKKLVDQVFAKLKEVGVCFRSSRQPIGLSGALLTYEGFGMQVWDPSVEDPSVAQYCVALVARGLDKKKLTSNMKTMLGESATAALLDWCVFISLGSVPCTACTPWLPHIAWFPNLFVTLGSRRLLKYVRNHSKELTASQAAPAAQPAAAPS